MCNFSPLDFPKSPRWSYQWELGKLEEVDANKTNIIVTMLETKPMGMKEPYWIETP